MMMEHVVTCEEDVLGLYEHLRTASEGALAMHVYGVLGDFIREKYGGSVQKFLAPPAPLMRHQ